MEEAEWALSAAMAREAELSQAVEVSKVKASKTDDQALLASTCMTYLEEEQQMMMP